MENDIKFVDRDIECVLYKRPKSKFWYTRFQFNKQQYRFSTKTDDTQKAKKFTYDIIDRLERDKDDGFVRRSHTTLTTESRGMTFNHLYESFVKFKKGKVSATSLIDYGRRSKTLLACFGEWEVLRFEDYGINLYGIYLDYRSTHREKYQSIKGTQGKKLPETLSGKTLNTECILLHTILKYGKYDLNLFRNWEIPVFTEHHRQKENHEITCPSQKEYQLMKDYWLSKSDNNTHYRPIINLWMRLQSNTGMRKIEMENLLVTDITDGSNGKILYIRNRKNKVRSDNKITTPFPITKRIEPFIIDILNITNHSRELLKNSGNEELIKESNYLFLDPDTNRKLGDFKKTWDTMLIRLKLDNRYTVKTLRKIFITKMVKQSSIPLSLLANLIGHTNINTLQKYYLHLRPDDLRHGLERGYMEIENKKKHLPV